MRELTTCADVSAYASVRAEPNWTALGKRLGKAMAPVAAGIKALTAEQLAAYEAGATLTVAGAELAAGDLAIVREFRKPADAPECDAAGDGDVLVVLELGLDESLLQAGLAREAVARVQRARKAAGVSAGDAISVRLASADAPLRAALEACAAYLADALGAPPMLLAPGEAAPAAAAPLRVLIVEQAELSSGAALEVTLLSAALAAATL